MGHPVMTKLYLVASQMRERGKVAAGADGPLLGDPWEAGGVEGVDELPQSARCDAGVALGQHVDAQGQQHPESERLTTTESWSQLRTMLPKSSSQS